MFLSVHLTQERFTGAVLKLLNNPGVQFQVFQTVTEYRTVGIRK